MFKHMLQSLSQMYNVKVVNVILYDPHMSGRGNHSQTCSIRSLAQILV